MSWQKVKNVLLEDIRCMQSVKSLKSQIQLFGTGAEIQNVTKLKMYLRVNKNTHLFYAFV
ncbi:hypothetical protein AGMMS50239_24400 [Bacteroidia bacterium]|nr:hypothetical protein AGMMS50239_24400 [Bacteroidia bacterium]